MKKPPSVILGKVRDSKKATVMPVWIHDEKGNPIRKDDSELGLIDLINEDNFIVDLFGGLKCEDIGSAEILVDGTIIIEPKSNFGGTT